MEVTKKYIQKNLEKTKKAVNSVKVSSKGEKLFDMVERYVSDAEFFMENGKLNEALGAVEYAHGLLDAGVYMGLFEVLENADLFVFKKD
ncbi:MAG: DUF357 domain-containing protein [Candidatus Undinarchaeales archaeon]